MWQEKISGICNTTFATTKRDIYFLHVATETDRGRTKFQEDMLNTWK